MDEQLKQGLLLGREHFQKQEYDKAEAYLNQVLTVDDRFADVHDMLGLIAHSRGNYQGAEDHFTRALAIIPAVIVIGIYGEGKVTSLLILSQVILSFQLPFAVIPLVQFTSSRAKMGSFVNSRLTAIVAWVIAITIVAFNAELLYLTFRG